MEELKNILIEKKNVVLICPNSLKKRLLLNVDKLINVTYKTPKEAQNDLLGYYDDIAIYEIKKLLNTNYEYAKRVYNNLTVPNINNDEIYLLKEKLKKYYHKPINYRKEIIVATKINSLLEKALENRQVLFYERKEKNNIIVKHYKTIIKEVEALAHNVCKLIDKGENDIEVYYNNSDYESVIKNVFSFYDITYNLNTSSSLFEIPSANKCIDDVDYIEKIIDQSLKNKVVETFNSLVGYSYTKDDLIDCFKHTTFSEEKNKNAIEIRKYNLFNPYAKYVFIIGLNYSVIPSIIKDDDYLSDMQKEQLGIKTSTQENKYENAYFQKTSKQCDNLYLSYTDVSLSTELMISPLIDNVVIEDTTYDYSFKRAKLEFNKENYSYNKYKVKGINYEDLLKTFEKRETYNNEYNQINPSLVNSFIVKDNEMELSYSKLSSFLECPFKYFSAYILKLESKNDNANIGNFFHTLLEDYYKNNDFDEALNKAYEQIELNDIYKDKYKEYAKRLIDAIDNQNKKIIYQDFFLESNVQKDLGTNPKIRLVGKIDKFYLNNNSATVVDYKSSSDNASLKKNGNRFIFDEKCPKTRQLVFYFILLDGGKIDNKEVHYDFGGMFLQHVMPKKASELSNEKFYFLDGYANEKNIDNLSGLMLNTNNVLTDEQLCEIKECLLNEIDKYKKMALQGEFSITPSKDSCMYCPYKGFCLNNNYETKEE